MKKALLKLGNTVEFLKDGMINDGTLVAKNAYNADIEAVTTDEQEDAVITVPYKDIKSIVG